MMAATGKPARLMRTDVASSGAVVDYARLDARLEAVAREYPQAEPYPHVVLGEFLEPAVARQVMREFPPVDPSAWIHYTHVNERKYGKSDGRGYDRAKRVLGFDDRWANRRLGLLSRLRGR